RGDADAPPERVGQLVTFGPQGQLVDQGMQAPFYEEEEWDEFTLDDPTSLLPTDRMIQLEGWGDSFGNPKVMPCPECSWQHEICAKCRRTTVGACRREGCGCTDTLCSWCGQAKSNSLLGDRRKEGAA